MTSSFAGWRLRRVASRGPVAVALGQSVRTRLGQSRDEGGTTGFARGYVISYVRASAWLFKFLLSSSSPVVGRVLVRIRADRRSGIGARDNNVHGNNDNSNNGQRRNNRSQRTRCGWNARHLGAPATNPSRETERDARIISNQAARPESRIDLYRRKGDAVKSPSVIVKRTAKKCPVDRFAGFQCPDLKDTDKL